MRRIFLLFSSFVLFTFLGFCQTTNRVIILYDAFGKPSPANLTQDWGYSALVEYGGKRILFDTGNNPEIFAHNVKALGVDLKKLDFVVISHRHADHTPAVSPTCSVSTPA